jgi:hypothetical protein
MTGFLFAPVHNLPDEREREKNFGFDRFSRRCNFASRNSGIEGHSLAFSDTFS